MSVPSTDRGICVGVDRASHIVLIQFPTVPDVTPAVVPVPYLGRPPYPLSTVQLLETASGSLLALGPIGDDEDRFKEDFVQFADLAPAVVGSESWEGVGSAWNVASTATGCGTLRLTTGGSSGNHLGLRGASMTLTAPPALWLEAKCSISTTSSRNFRVGFVDTGIANTGSLFSPSNELVCVSESTTAGGALYLIGRNNGAPTSGIDTGYVPSASTPFYMHLIVSGGTFAAAWIATEPAVDDEYTVQGPFTLESPNVPSSSVGPGFAVQQASGSAVNMDVDYLRVHTVWPIASPADLQAATA